MIDVVSLLLVAGASVVGAAVFVALCSFGLRLLVTHGRPLIATIGAYACFALCAGCVALAVYLIVPVWHR